MLNPMKLSALGLSLALLLASCGGNTGTTLPDDSTTIEADDVYTDDDGGEVTAEKTITLNAGQSLRPLVSTGDPGTPSGPVTVTAQIVRATAGKYAGQVKGALTLTYSGGVVYKGDFSLKLATAGGASAFLIAKRKNDSKDSTFITIRPTKGKTETTKKLTIQYADALNGGACMYLAYDLKDNAGAGPAQLTYSDPAPLLCEPDGSAQTTLQTALMGASSGYLYNAQPWSFTTVSGPAAPAATLASLPADISGAPKQDFTAFFAPLIVAPTPVDPTKPTAAETAAKAKAASAKKLQAAMLKNYKVTQLGVYTTATEVYVVGVNSWGVAGLKTVK
jgi:hypothetical protein